MFCTACATFNPTSDRCAGCGAGLRVGGEEQRAARGRRVRAIRSWRPLKRRGVLRLALYGLPLVVLLALGALYARATWWEPASWYRRGEAAISAGRYPEAINAFAAAGDYRDAVARRETVVAAFADQMATVNAAAVALADGRHDEALALLIPVVRALPTYEEAAGLLRQARAARADDLVKQTDQAEARGDWLAAERALADLVATNPADATLATRLARLRRAHAPIVLATGGVLSLVGPDGTIGRTVTDTIAASWPTWSPDRTRIAFASDDDTIGGHGIGVYVVTVDGTGLRHLAGDLRPFTGPVWSPDGTRLAYATETTFSQPGMSITDRTIRVMEIATGTETDLTSTKIPDAFYPSWSPRGDRIAFVSRRVDGLPSFDSPPAPGTTPSADGVYIATLATGEIREVARGEITSPWRVAWSPVSDRLLVYTRDPGKSFDRDRARLYLLDPNTGVSSQIDTGDARISMPVWSPDGTAFAYAEEDATVRVRAIAPGGLNLRISLDRPISQFLSWSPDGHALLAVADREGDPSFIIPLDDLATTPPVPAPIRLAYDTDRRLTGSPQWGPLRILPPPGMESISGAAHDPGGP
jgi:Tol biopolymer transport system component